MPLQPPQPAVAEQEMWKKHLNLRKNKESKEKEVVKEERHLYRYRS